MMSESEVQQRIQIELVKYGCQMMRNNNGSLPDVNGREVRYGLGNTSKQRNDLIKSSDLIGIMNGRFVAIEVKKEGWKFNPNDKREVAQLAFIIPTIS